LGELNVDLMQYRPQFGQGWHLLIDQGDTLTGVSQDLNE